MSKNQMRILAFSMAVLAALILTVLCSRPALAQGIRVRVLSSAIVNGPLHSDVSLPLRSIAPQFAPRSGASQHVRPILRPKLQQLRAAVPQRGSAVGSALPGPIIDATIGMNFDGVGQNETNNCPNVSGFAVVPPDTNLAVGDTQLVQWVNLCYAVFDKATGNLVAGPFAGNAFWAGFAGGCQEHNDGDPIIQWDKANHVWVASQNDFGSGVAGFKTCIAVSTTADATGSYNRFSFPQPGFPDYPKWGLTSAAYYQTQNNFGNGSAFVGVTVCAYDAVKLRTGSPEAKQICIVDNSDGTLFDDSMLPADLDSNSGHDEPAPEVLLGSIDNPGFNSAVYQYVFTVTFKGKGKATLAGTNGTMPLAVPTFALACGGGACIPQPRAGIDLLDSLGDRLMYRLARFDDGTTQHFLVNHSVNQPVNGGVGARWYEFTAPTGSTSLSLAQSGETPDDGKYRWMGSIARDTFGNIALGYSRSSATERDFPSIYLSGQTAGEPAGTTDAESLIFAGSGSQLGSFTRWGDYSGMALDGADHCSFWYTNEYYPKDGSFAWNTRIAGPIKFSGCP